MGRELEVHVGMLPRDETGLEHPRISGVAHDELELGKVTGHLIEVTRVPEIARARLRPVGRRVHAAGNVELDALLVGRVVVTIGSRLADHEWAQTETAKAAVLDPVLDVAHRRSAAKD